MEIANTQNIVEIFVSYRFKILFHERSCCRFRVPEGRMSSYDPSVIEQDGHIFLSCTDLLRQSDGFGL